VDVVENRRPVDSALGTAETTGEVHQRQEFLVEPDESETGSSLARFVRLTHYKNLCCLLIVHIVVSCDVTRRTLKLC